MIAVTGHTDRIGAHAYNMTLSTHRAQAVKAYLVESAGISANKIVATGVDGADPVTKPDDCKGRKATKQLKACLQPDRRVDVEVTGRSNADKMPDSRNAVVLGATEASWVNKLGPGLITGAADDDPAALPPIRKPARSLAITCYGRWFSPTRSWWRFR